MSNIREDIERGNLHLIPFPDRVNHQSGKYQRTTLYNPRNGQSFEIIRLSRENTPDIRVYGDIPIPEEDVEKFTNEIEQKSLFHCEVREIHEHEITRDVHPKCNFHTDDQFKEIFPAVYSISHKYAEKNADKYRKNR